MILRRLAATSRQPPINSAISDPFGHNSAMPNLLIPRQTFFANPDRTNVTISPDGHNLAYLAPRDGVLNIWVAPTDSPNQARSITHTKERIWYFEWAYNGRDILY